jgi:hypothetical protein
MPFQAHVFNVMIASPGDVKGERAIVPQVVHQWNALHSSTRKIVLLPVAYETHAAPLAGEAPQATINWQVLKGSDLLIAVFWTRLGTPTEEYPSGTVEEIERHLEAGKPALLYFSSAPVVPGSYDEKQFRALLKFKESMQKRGLHGFYEDLADFRAKVSHHLTTVLNTHPYFQAAEGPPGSPGPSDLPPGPKIPSLSKEAAQLLREAVSDPSGTLLCLRSSGGLHIQANGKAFTETGDRRSEATWLAAVKELIGHDLVEDRGYKGEVLEVTKRGYEVAELLPA